MFYRWGQKIFNLLFADRWITNSEHYFPKMISRCRRVSRCELVISLMPKLYGASHLITIVQDSAPFQLKQRGIKKFRTRVPRPLSEAVRKLLELFTPANCTPKVYTRYLVDISHSTTWTYRGRSVLTWCGYAYHSPDLVVRSALPITKEKAVCITTFCRGKNMFRTVVLCDRFSYSAPCRSLLTGSKIQAIRFGCLVNEVTPLQWIGRFNRYLRYVNLITEQLQPLLQTYVSWNKPVFNYFWKRT